MTVPTLEAYLEEVGRFAGDAYGRRVRGCFADRDGDSERAVLVAPSAEEFAALGRAVAIMTVREKEQADRLSDEQVQTLAADAGVDPALLAIFFNGYTLTCKRVSCPSVAGTEIRHSGTVRKEDHGR